MEWEMNHERLWTQGNKLRVLEGRGVRGWVSLVMSINPKNIKTQFKKIYAAFFTAFFFRFYLFI